MSAIAVILILIGCVIAWSLALRLLRTTLIFIGELIDGAVAVIFMVLVVPVLWLWHKAKRPMWRTLTKEQTRELEAWLRRAT